MTATATATPFDEIKAKQQVTWSSGDYGKIAWLTVPLAEELVVAAEAASRRKRARRRHRHRPRRDRRRPPVRR